MPAEVTREGQNWDLELILILLKHHTRLYKLGFAHSVEAYHDGILAGGYTGSASKGIFGKVMFHLVARCFQSGILPPCP